MSHSINTNHGNIFHITALIAGALISRYIRTTDNIESVSRKVNTALNDADSITVETVSIYDVQYNKKMNYGYDAAVNRDDLAICE